MTRIKIKVSWGQLALGSFDATVSNNQIRLRAQLNDNVNQLPENSLHQVQSIVRSHAREFLKDTRYCYIENIDSGIKSYLQFV